jgi:hypothetical protein
MAPGCTAGSSSRQSPPGIQRGYPSRSQSSAARTTLSPSSVESARVATIFRVASSLVAVAIAAICAINTNASTARRGGPSPTHRFASRQATGASNHSASPHGSIASTGRKRIAAAPNASAPTMVATSASCLKLRSIVGASDSASRLAPSAALAAATRTARCPLLVSGQAQRVATTKTVMPMPIDSTASRGHSFVAASSLVVVVGRSATLPSAIDSVHAAAPAAIVPSATESDPSSAWRRAATERTSGSVGAIVAIAASVLTATRGPNASWGAIAQRASRRSADSEIATSALARLVTASTRAATSAIDLDARAEECTAYAASSTPMISPVSAPVAKIDATAPAPSLDWPTR